MVEQYTNEETCLRCHADKRGPFVFEHPPVKVEGCEGCHVPHGSMNARLLTRPVVFTVAPTLRSDVVKDVGEFRRKDLFDFRSFTATHVEFTRGAETQAFDRTKEKDGKDVWKAAGGKTNLATPFSFWPATQRDAAFPSWHPES